MKRLFTQTHTVRYDECNSEGYLTPSAFLRYMQDIAALDAEDAQLEGNGYWIIKRSVMSFATAIPIHTRLHLQTFGLSFTRITAQRGYEAHFLEARDAEPAISAHSLWVYIDTRGRPARLPEKTGQIWLPDGFVPSQPDAPFPPMPASAPATTFAVVRFSDVDLMKHLNNASVVEMLDNAAWEVYAQAGITPAQAQLSPRDYDIEYLDSPLFGEKLEIQTWHETFPASGQEFTRLQTVTRNGNVVARARSRWFWHAD